MNGELYLKKGMLQLNKKLYDEALETLNKVIELDNDLASVTSVKCILGEYYFTPNITTKTKMKAILSMQNWQMCYIK